MKVHFIELLLKEIFKYLVLDRDSSILPLQDLYLKDLSRNRGSNKAFSVYMFKQSLSLFNGQLLQVYFLLHQQVPS